MKKIIIFSLLFALIIPVFCFSASAETFNYLDYITNVQVDGEKNIVTVDLPCFSNRYDVWNSLNAEHYYAFAPSMVYHFEKYDRNQMEYDINFSPSWDGKNVNFLSLVNMPTGTELNIWLDIESHYADQEGPTIDGVVYPQLDFDWASSGARFQYFLEGNRVATQLADFGLYDTHPIEGENNYTFEFYCEGVLQDPTQEDNNLFVGVDSFYPTFYLNNCRFNYDVDLKISIVKYQLVFHIEQLLIGGDYGKILDSINNSLAKQGKYIDELTGAIKAVPTPIAPPDSAIVGDVIDLEGNLAGFAQDNLGVANQYMQGVNGILNNLGPSLLACSAFLNHIIALPFIQDLFIIAVCVGLIGLVLNLAASAISSAVEASEKKDRDRKRSIDKWKRDVKAEIKSKLRRST